MKKENATISQKLDVFLSTAQNKSYFVGFVTFLFFILFMLFAVVPAYSSVLAQNDENGKILEETQKADAKLRTFESLNLQKEQKKSIVDNFTKIFGNDNSQQNIIQIIYEKADANGVHIRSTQFPEKYRRAKPLALEVPGVAVQVSPIQVIINLEGSREQIYNFIKTIEQERLILNILRLSISKKTQTNSQNENSKGDFSSQVEIEYYFYDITKVEPQI